MTAWLSAAPRARIVQVLFHIGVISKGIDGALEVLGGVLLFVVSPAGIHGIVRMLTQHELSEDPHDFIATYLLNSTAHLSAGAQGFAAIYLLWHGVVKMGLVTALLLKQFWAYPAAIVTFLLFVVYQLYRYSHTPRSGASRALGSRCLRHRTHLAGVQSATCAAIFVLTREVVDRSLIVSEEEA